MEAVKDWVWLIVTVGGIFVGALGALWRSHYKVKRHGERLDDCEARIEKLEKGDTSTGRKLTIIERNLVKIMEHLNIEPVKELFDGE